MSALPVTVKEFSRGRDTVRVRIDLYNGREVVDVRTWYTDKAGALHPGRSGITLSLDKLPELAAGLRAALDEAKRLGLLADRQPADGG